MISNIITSSEGRNTYRIMLCLYIENIEVAYNSSEEFTTVVFYIHFQYSICDNFQYLDPFVILCASVDI